MAVIWTNFDPENYTNPVAGPVDNSGLSPAQKLGIELGRQAKGSREQLERLMNYAGLTPGEPAWGEAMKAGREVLKLTLDREARTMMVQKSDGSFLPDEDYRDAAAMKVEQL